MKNTTRILAIILAAMTAISLSACGGEGDETTTASVTTDAVTDATTTEAAETAPAEPESTVTWKYEDGTLTFSGIGKMPDYISAHSVPWDRYRSEIETIIIEDGVESISRGVFATHKSLKSVTISETVTSIGEVAFSNCTALTSVEIPESVTFIDEMVFSNCTSLTTVKLYANADLRYNIFNRCDAITDFTVGDNYVYEDGILYSKDMTVLIACLDKNITEANIRNGVIFIGDRAFDKRLNLTSVTIPDTVTEIGKYAFANCYKLETATIPSSVTKINDSAFEYDAKLTATIDNSKENVTLGEYAFAQNATVIWAE